jgi:hypothetical protein
MIDCIVLKKYPVYFTEYTNTKNSKTNQKV